MFLLFIKIGVFSLINLSVNASVFKLDFEDINEGAIYERSQLIVTRDEMTGAHYLRSTYEPASNGSARLLFNRNFAASDEYTLNYRVYFENGFDFKKGGKMHGLGPQAPVTGCQAEAPEKWSVRLMWGANGALSLYTYEQNRTTNCGRGQRAQNFSFQTGKWYDVAIYVKLNEAKKSNGIIHVYIDGEPVILRNNARLRDVSTQNTLIQRFLFSTFYGGSNSDWAPSRTTYARFDDFEVLSGLNVRTTNLAQIAYDRAVMDTTNIIKDRSKLIPSRTRPNGGELGIYWDTARLNINLASNEINDVRLASSMSLFNENLIREYAKVFHQLSHRMVASVGGQLPVVELKAHSYLEGEISFRFPQLPERKFRRDTASLTILRAFSKDLSQYLSLSAQPAAKNALLSVNWDHNFAFNYARIASRFMANKSTSEIDDYFYLKANLLRPSFVRPNGTPIGQYWDTATIRYHLVSGQEIERRVASSMSQNNLLLCEQYIEHFKVFAQVIANRFGVPLPILEVKIHSKDLGGISFRFNNAGWINFKLDENPELIARSFKLHLEKHLISH